MVAAAAAAVDVGRCAVADSMTKALCSDSYWSRSAGVRSYPRRCPDRLPAAAEVAAADAAAGSYVADVASS